MWGVYCNHFGDIDDDLNCSLPDYPSVYLSMCHTLSGRYCCLRVTLYQEKHVLTVNVKWNTNPLSLLSKQTASIRDYNFWVIMALVNMTVLSQVLHSTVIVSGSVCTKACVFLQDNPWWWEISSARVWSHLWPTVLLGILMTTSTVLCQTTTIVVEMLAPSALTHQVGRCVESNLLGD